jgi:adenylate kinase family enzyme
MKGLDFPIVNSKVKGSDDYYDLSNPETRKKYFEDKIGKEIRELKDFMGDNTFIAYMLGKKQAGKGTYTKLLIEIFGEDTFKHLSVGDLVRHVDQARQVPEKEKELMDYLERNYRGFIPLEDAYEAFINRGTKSLIPTEFILTLVKREIELSGRISLFIDGFPRDMDQITYSLYFRELINYRDDPDLFVLIDVPEAVIDERIKYRRICPKCQTSRNLKLLPTSDVRYDEGSKEFYLMCDNPDCEPTKYVGKEGDDLGIEAIRERIEMDDNLIRKSFNLHGVPKVLLRNSVPVELAEDLVDKYEITKFEDFSLDDNGEVVSTEREWSIIDDNEIESYSLKAPTVALELIKQLHKILV